MKSLATKKAFTLVELMVTVSIITILAVLTYRSSRIILVKSNLVGQIAGMKGVILKSRIQAVERTAPVLVSLANGKMLSRIDLDRSGDFGKDFNGNDDPKELIIGDDLDTGISFDYNKVSFIQVTDPAVSGEVIPHPSGAYDIKPGDGTGYSTFPNDEFIITPTGLVRDNAGNRAPIYGTFFVKTDNNEMVGLIHVTALGEIRTAIKNKNETDWVWQ